MNCPECGAPTYVAYTRSRETSISRRRHCCIHDDHRFTTRETLPITVGFIQVIRSRLLARGFSEKAAEEILAPTKELI